VDVDPLEEDPLEVEDEDLLEQVEEVDLVAAVEAEVDEVAWMKDPQQKLLVSQLYDHITH
jgi:hypothetical protein